MGLLIICCCGEDRIDSHGSYIANGNGLFILTMRSRGEADFQFVVDGNCAIPNDFMVIF